MSSFWFKTGLIIISYVQMNQSILRKTTWFLTVLFYYFNFRFYWYLFIFYLIAHLLFAAAFSILEDYN